MTEEKNSGSESEQTDLSLTAIIKALDSGTSMPDAQDSGKQDAFDPNATINYQQAGASYPEFPFVSETNAAEGHESTLTQERERISAAPSLETRRTAASDLGQQASREGRSQQTATRPASQTQTSTSGANATRRVPSRTARTAAANTTTRPAQSSFDPNSIDNSTSFYHPLNMQKSSYKIRGGGGRKFNSRSPVLIVASALVVIIGIGILAYGLNSILGAFSGGSNDIEFELTTTETREAIDSRIPVLAYYVDASIDDSLATLAETQWVYTNDRHTPDSPDASAYNLEIVSMPQEMSVEQMEGYYSGSYNAYSVEELTQLFNGTYTFDLARGDLGSWNKLRYVNFNATSIEDEMTHLAALQDLAGDSVTISAEGYDSQGNKVIQGIKAVGEDSVLYFKIAACPFKELYSAEPLTDASVYITCTVANYDFFTGADEITPAE